MIDTLTTGLVALGILVMIIGILGIAWEYKGITALVISILILSYTMGYIILEIL